MGVRIVKIVDKQHFVNHALTVMIPEIVIIVKIYAHVVIVMIVKTVHA